MPRIKNFYKEKCRKYQKQITELKAEIERLNKVSKNWYDELGEAREYTNKLKKEHQCKIHGCIADACPDCIVTGHEQQITQMEAENEKLRKAVKLVCELIRISNWKELKQEAGK
jgi:hypothetical protein